MSDRLPDSLMARDFRALMTFFPTGVSVVTTVAPDGRPHGMTCTSLTSVTLTPSTLLVCLNNGSGTLQALFGSGRFAVNLLRSDSHGTAKLFAGPFGDRFDRVTWSPSAHSGSPALQTDSVAVADCRLIDTTTVGDHTIVLGQVMHTWFAGGRPLLYGFRSFSSWPAVVPPVTGQAPDNQSTTLAYDTVGNSEFSDQGNR